MTEETAWLTAWVRDIALAFPLARVREAMLWVPPQPGPPGKPGFAGILALRGETWPVLDLAARWGWSARRPGPETSYLMLADPDGRPMGAVLVDRVGWVLEGQASAVDQDSNDGHEEMVALFDSVVADPETEEEYFVIDIDRAMKRVGIS